MSRSLLIFAALFFSTAANAEEWQHFQSMPENKGTYETILIETKGIFNKEAIIWLRASYNLDEPKCNKAESYLTPYNAQVAEAFCMMSANNRLKETVYKLSLDRKNKNITYLQVSSKNRLDKPTSDSLPIQNHPGSLGYSLIQHYCQWNYNNIINILGGQPYPAAQH